MKIKNWKVYWVTDFFNAEDWFIVSTNERTAKRFYAEYEGMDFSDTKSELIIENITDNFQETRHLQIEDLEKLGFEIIQKDVRRIVELNGRKFKEGKLDSDLKILHSMPRNID